MRALTLWQPWATLVAIGAKQIETRSWGTDYRGPLAIASAKMFPREWQKLCIEEPFLSVLRGHFGDGFYPYDLPLGCVLTVVSLADCQMMTEALIAKVEEQEHAFGWYEPGRFAWILRDTKPLPEPIRARGGQRLWNWKPEQAE